MSINIRAYADTALEQGKQVGQRAESYVADLRAQAEKALNLEAIKSAVEPYLAQAKEYRTALTDRATGLVDGVTSDKRVAKLVDTAESLSTTVVGTVQERVVKPVQDLTGFGKQPTRASSAPKAPSTKPASTRPAPKPSAKPAAKSTSKPATKRATTSASTATARKSTAKKAAPKA